jgi:hypothetical protein
MRCQKTEEVDGVQTTFLQMEDGQWKAVPWIKNKTRSCLKCIKTLQKKGSDKPCNSHLDQW